MGRGRNRKVKITFNKRGLILCEGETEENYFKGLVTQEKYRRKFSSINVSIYKPKNHSPIGLVDHAKEKIKQAKREKNQYDFVWVVFDKDGHKGIPDAFELARTSNPEIRIAFTVPCFEFYVLLHFGKTTKPFNKCDDVIHEIISKKELENYTKASNLFKLLEPYKDVGNINSEWVVDQFKDNIKAGERVYHLSAYSNIHELVNFLYSLI